MVTEAASAALASVSAGTTALRANELSVETGQAGARTIVVVIGRIATEVGPRSRRLPVLRMLD